MPLLINLSWLLTVYQIKVKLSSMTFKIQDSLRSSNRTTSPLNSFSFCPSAVRKNHGAVDRIALWGMVVQAHVWNWLSGGERGWHIMSRARQCALGQGKRNVTRLELAVAWPGLTGYNKSRYLGHGKGKRKKTKISEESRKFPRTTFLGRLCRNCGH